MAGTFLSLHAHAEIVLKTRLTSAVVGVTASRDGLGNINDDDTKNFTADFSTQTLNASKTITGVQASSSGEATGSGQLTLDTSLDTLDLTASSSSSASANATSEPGHARFSQANTTAHGMIVSFELTGHSYTYTVTGHVSATGSSEFFVSRGEGGVTISSDGGNQIIFDARARITETQNTESKDFAGSGTLSPGRWRIYVSNGSIATAGSNNLPSGNSSASANCEFKLRPVGVPPPPPSDIHWTNIAGGAFARAANWNPATVPNNGSTAIFGLDTLYTVNVGSAVSSRLMLINGDVSFSHLAYTLNALSPTNPSLFVDGAKLTLLDGELLSSHALIGDSAEAAVDVKAGAKWLSQGMIEVGRGGAGLLAIEAGGVVTNADSRIGNGSNGGKALIQGHGSKWQTGNLAIGFSGSGQMWVKDGASVVSSGAVIGLSAALDNVVTVQGVSAEGRRTFWQVPGQLKIGGANIGGVLRIEEGGWVDATDIIVADTEITGIIQVIGGHPTGAPPEFSSSFLEADNALTIGAKGFASVSIEDGGQAQAIGNITIGSMTAPLGPVDAKVTVSGRDFRTGAPSILGSLSGDLNVGYGGKLTIEDRAEVFAETGRITGNGRVFVDGEPGARSRLTFRHDLTIGGGITDPTLDLDGGQVLVQGRLSIGPNGRVSGHGSIFVNAWENSGTVSLGVPILSGVFPASGHASASAALHELSEAMVPARTEPAAPAATNLLQVEGSFTQTDEAVLAFAIDGVLARTNYMQISVSSNAVLGGTLRCRFVNGFAPKFGDTFNLLSITGKTSGAFSAVEFQNLAPGFQFTVSTNGPIVSLTALTDAVFLAPLPHGIQANAVTKGGITYVPYVLQLDSPSYPYLPSGRPVRNGDQIVQVLSESLLRAVCGNGPTLVTNTLVLGALPPGNYQFRFVADGVTVQILPITVPSGTGQLLTAELAPSKTALNLIVNGWPGLSYSIQASANLIDWMPIFTQAGSFTFTEAFAKNSRPRFNRIRIGN